MDSVRDNDFIGATVVPPEMLLELTHVIQTTADKEMCGNPLNRSIALSRKKMGKINMAHLKY